MPIQRPNHGAIKIGRIGIGAHPPRYKNIFLFGPTGIPEQLNAYPNNYSTLRPPYLGDPLVYDPHPMATHLDTATIPIYRHLVQQGTAEVYPPSGVPEMGPYEHGNFFTTKPRPIVYRTNQAAKNSDTPFHPKKRQPVAPHKQRASVPIGPVFLASFVSRTRLHADPNRTQIRSGEPGAGRWDSVERGAAG